MTTMYKTGVIRLMEHNRGSRVRPHWWHRRGNPKTLFILGAAFWTLDAVICGMIIQQVMDLMHI